MRSSSATRPSISPLAPTSCSSSSLRRNRSGTSSTWPSNNFRTPISPSSTRASPSSPRRKVWLSAAVAKSASTPRAFTPQLKPTSASSKPASASSPAAAAQKKSSSTQTKVLGDQFLSAAKLMIHMLVRGGYASEYDAVVARKLANIFSGGPLTSPQLVTEQYVLDLEREAFVGLCGEKLTQARIAHT